MIGEHVSGKVIRHFGPVHYISPLSRPAAHVLALWATRAGPRQAANNWRLTDAPGAWMSTLTATPR